MVETYEGEVSKLENSLNLLKSHNFGNGQAQELQSALGKWEALVLYLSGMRQAGAANGALRD